MASEPSAHQPGGAVPPLGVSLDQLARAQRYAWAAQVCPDETVHVLDAGADDAVAFENRARPVPSEAAGRELLQDAGAVVWLDGADRAADPERTLSLLVELARAGRPVVVALPNGRAFDQRGLGARAVYGIEEAKALQARLPAGRLFPQHVLAATMIHSGALDSVTGDLPAAAAEPDGARAWLVCANVRDDRLHAVRRPLALGARPLQADLVAALEEANAELRRANARLARRHLGRHDSAAASMIDKLDRRVESAERRLEIEIEVAKNNDLLFQRARAALDTPRYRAVDAVRAKVLAVPGVAAFARFARRRLRG